MFRKTTLNCRGNILDLESPKIMGILNLTPDSFYDGGRWNDANVLNRVEQMLIEGADIIDIGAFSSRPGSSFITAEEELQRIIKPLAAIVSRFPDAIISIDTFRAEVVNAVYCEGAHIINDISAAAFDEKLFETVGKTGLPYILMHMKGNPQNMQQNPVYENILSEVADFFIEKIKQLYAYGVKDIILDPGFGFGKTLDQNYRLLAGMKCFEFLELPVLTGVSRKSMVCRALDLKPEDALNGSTALHMLCLENGASILRVHDIKEASEAIKIWNLYKKHQSDTTFISKITSLPV
jgi:dihydropteroate synthase